MGLCPSFCQIIFKSVAVIPPANMFIPTPTTDWCALSARQKYACKNPITEHIITENTIPTYGFPDIKLP